MSETEKPRSAISTPMLPSIAWTEIVEADEQVLFEDFAQAIAARQREDAQQSGGPVRRGFHAKLHAGMAAEFQVLPDLPSYARFGVFRDPLVLPALVRFSNGEPIVNRDTKGEPRGIAIKLVGVPGPKLLAGEENAMTQDFLATSHSLTSIVRNARQFIAFIRASRPKYRLLFALPRDVGVSESLRIIKGYYQNVLSSKVRSMATEEYSSTAPIKCGPYAVKFIVRAAEGTGTATSRPLTKNFLRDELVERLRKKDLIFDFLLQFFVDDARTPIEDTSILWRTDVAPLVKVAQLCILRCDLDDPKLGAMSEAVDRLSFSPWHTTEEHRPLGSIMRARRTAYRVSSALRGKSPEPTGLPL